MPTDDAPDHVKLKICLVGDEAVGKSSLVRRYVLSQFDERYVRTVGAVVTKRIAIVPAQPEPLTVVMTVWDIIGRLEFASRYEKAYLGNAAGVLAVFDLTRRTTLEGLGLWLDRVRAVSGDVPTIVLANKRDLGEQVRVDEDEILALCELYGTPFLETSARSGDNVERAFGKITEMAVRAVVATHRRDSQESRVREAPLPVAP